MLLTCIVEAYPPPTAKIIKLSEDWENGIDISESDLVSKIIPLRLNKKSASY